MAPLCYPATVLIQLMMPKFIHFTTNYTWSKKSLTLFGLTAQCHHEKFHFEMMEAGINVQGKKRVLIWSRGLLGLKSQGLLRTSHCWSLCWFWWIWLAHFPLQHSRTHTAPSLWQTPAAGVVATFVLCTQRQFLSHSCFSLSSSVTYTQTTCKVSLNELPFPWIRFLTQKEKKASKVQLTTRDCTAFINGQTLSAEHPALCTLHQERP